MTPREPPNFLYNCPVPTATPSSRHLEANLDGRLSAKPCILPPEPGLSSQHLTDWPGWTCETCDIQSTVKSGSSATLLAGPRWLTAALPRQEQPCRDLPPLRFAVTPA